MSQLALSFVWEECAYFERSGAVRLWTVRFALPVVWVLSGTREWPWLICGCLGVRGVSGQVGDFGTLHQRMPVCRKHWAGSGRSLHLCRNSSAEGLFAPCRLQVTPGASCCGSRWGGGVPYRAANCHLKQCYGRSWAGPGLEVGPAWLQIHHSRAS